MQTEYGAALALALLLACGCDASGGTDAGVRVDGGGDRDAGETRADGGRDPDAGRVDAGATDAGPSCADDGTDDVREGATDLGMIDDRSSFPSGTEAVTVFPVIDFDWLTWHVEDVAFANVQPRAELRGLSGGGRLELCAWFQCDSTTMSVSCDLGTAHELSAELRGCCAVGTDADLAVKLVPSCDGIDESGRVYVRVGQQGGAATCTAYDLAWGDD